MNYFEKTVCIKKYGFIYNYILRNFTSLVNSRSYSSKKDINTVSFAVSNEKIKSERSNFVCDLFSGKLDKSILEYPLTLQTKEIDLLVDYSTEVENFINNSVSRSNKFDFQLLNDLRKLKLFGLSVPKKFGGLGYNVTETKFIQEGLCTNLDIGRFLMYNESVGMKIITNYGSTEQKLKYLPKLITGQNIVSFAYLEDAPFFDIQTIQANCIFNEKTNEFILNGKKKWVNYADIADLIIVLSKSNKSDNSQRQRFNLCITEKKNPGITVQELGSISCKEFSLSDIHFNNVRISRGDLIENEIECAYPILKMVLSSTYLDAAITCLSLLKQLLHSATEYARENYLGKSLLKEHSYIQGNIGHLMINIYVLESLIYLVSASMDRYSNTDLFMDSCVTKILALDFLSKGIQKYCEIVGTDIYKTPNLVEDATKILQYHSILDDNFNNLKLLIGTNGLIHASKFNGKIKDLIDVFRHSYDYPFKKIIHSFNIKNTIALNLDLKQYVHSSLTEEADILEDCLHKLNLIVIQNFIYFGRNILEKEKTITIMSEMAVYIYALAACLSRSSTFYTNEPSSSQLNFNIARVFARQVQAELQLHFDELEYFRHLVESYQHIGKYIFGKKQYPLEHPLSRSY